MGGDRTGLVIGYVEGVTVARWRRVWAERYPDVPLEVLAVEQADQRRALETGRVDVCFVRALDDPDGLHVVALYEEVAVAVVPREHPASLYESVSLADLAGDDVLDADPAAHGGADPYDLVAGGAGILLVPHAVARARSRRDLVFRPVTDAPPTAVALAWRRDREHPATQDLVGVVRGRGVNSSRGTPPQPARRTGTTKRRRP